MVILNICCNIYPSGHRWKSPYFYARRCYVCPPSWPGSDIPSRNGFKLIICYRSLDEFQEPIHIELMRELNSASHVETMWTVQFFAQVIVKLERGPQAFIEAQGPILALNLASSDLNFFHVNTFDGPQPYIWGDAVKVLSRRPETARHRLLAVLELREGSPSQFPASRVFLKETKGSIKRHDEADGLMKRYAMFGEEPLIVSRCSTWSGCRVWP